MAQGDRYEVFEQMVGAFAWEEARNRHDVVARLEIGWIFITLGYGTSEVVVEVVGRQKRFEGRVHQRSLPSPLHIPDALATHARKLRDEDLSGVVYDWCYAHRIANGNGEWTVRWIGRDPDQRELQKRLVDAYSACARQVGADELIDGPKR